MQNTLLETEKPQPLDSANAIHLHAAEAALANGNLAKACEELRKIQRRVAGNPAIINLRRRLVAALLGLEEN